MALIVGNYAMDTTYDLGQGAYGTVFEGHIKDNKTQKVAAKRMTVLNENEFINIVEQEFKIMTNLSTHGNIVQVFDVKKVVNPRDTGQMYIWMFMELCSLGNLKKFYRDNKLGIPQKVDMMCQCADAVLFLHDKDIIHRDIKPENILLTGEKNRPTVKLTDFGTARAIERIQGKEKTMHSFVGTQSYMAPELFSQIENKTPSYKKTADTFSLGLTYLAMTEAEQGSELHSHKDGNALGQHLWNTQENTESIMKRDDPYFMGELKKIFNKMLRFQPIHRLSMEQVLQQLQEIQTFFAESILMTAGGQLEENLPRGWNNNISVNKNNRWLNIATCPDACQTMGVMICAVEDGLLFIGGDLLDENGSEGPAAQCQYYSLLYECWNKMADMPTPRAFGATIAIKNDVYVMGGLMENDDPGVTCEKLDVKENKWNSLCDLNIPVANHYVTKARGYIFLVPSYVTKRRNLSHRWCMLCYDPALNTCTEKSQMPDDVFIDGGSIVSVNEMLYLFGAAQENFQQYDPYSDHWTKITKPSMQITWMESNAAVRGTKIVLFHDREAEEYDTTNGSWRNSTTRLPQAMTDIDNSKYRCFTSYLNV